MPIVRTFVPVVAGAARMNYRTFLFYNVFGGIGWVTSMVLFGYYLIPFADPPFRKLLGRDDFTWAKNIDILAVLVIAVSVLPIAWKALKEWRSSRAAKRTELPAVNETTPVG